MNNYLNDLSFIQNLKFRQKEIDVLLNNELLESKKKTKLEKNINSFSYKIVQFVKMSNLRSMSLTRQKTEPKLLKELKNILQLSRDLVIKNNSKLYFVYLPEYNRFKVNYDNKNYNSVKNIAYELDIPFIDINKEVFEKDENPFKFFPFELNGHYNVLGYKRVAETIYKFTNE